jgi:molybdate transport system permease protein
LENIKFGLKSTSKAQDKRKITEKISSFRLEGLEDRLPHQLSGGQQQRVALARATIMEPELLLLDEPFSALDNYLRSQMEKELIEVLEGFDGTTLFVSHNLNEAYLVCHDLMILDNGRKIAHGKKEDLFKNPPNYTSAQVTGCKNISSVRVINSDTIEATDWGCRLKLAQSPPDNTTHVGIRAHHVTFVESLGPENVFPCWLNKTNETPFNMTLYLSLGSPDAANSYHLQAEVFKEQWMMMKDRPFPWLVHLDPDRLFLTTEV